VLGACRDLGVAVAITMAGGYAPDVDDIVDINIRTLLIAAAGAEGVSPSLEDTRDTVDSSRSR
jgi:hypothetical protein